MTVRVLASAGAWLAHARRSDQFVGNLFLIQSFGLHSCLLARMDTEDGLKAWGIVNRRHSESSAASESHYLKLFLGLKLEASAVDDGGKPKSLTPQFGFAGSAVQRQANNARRNKGKDRTNGDR